MIIFDDKSIPVTPGQVNGRRSPYLFQQPVPELNEAHMYNRLIYVNTSIQLCVFRPPSMSDLYDFQPDEEANFHRSKCSSYTLPAANKEALKAPKFSSNESL